MKKRAVAGPTSLETPSPLTIGRLAKAAGVGVETVRYYQSRGLLRVPAANGDAGRVARPRRTSESPGSGNGPAMLAG